MKLSFLNDFRWSEKIIPWHDLLLLFEGQTVYLPAPKSYHSKDIEFTHDAPIFELVYGRGGSIDSMESTMMRCHWCIFRLHSQIDASKQKKAKKKKVKVVSVNLLLLLLTAIAPLKTARKISYH